MFAISAVAALPKCLKALYLLLKHGTVASSMNQICQALLKALVHAGLIRTNITKLGVVTYCDKYGLVSCSLAGATTYEKSVFLDAMQEILGPIENPRYLMVRKTPLGGFIRKDYHVVPQALGRKREFAGYFAKMWGKYVGPTELIYTRSVEGRKLLIKARGSSLSSAFQSRSERIRAWK